MTASDVKAALDMLADKVALLEKGVGALETRRKAQPALPQQDLFASPIMKPTIDTGLMARKLDAIIANVETVLKA